MMSTEDNQMDTMTKKNSSMLKPAKKKKAKRENSGSSIRSKAVNTAVECYWETEPARAHEDDEMKNQLESSIDRKRLKVIMEGKIREEKAKFKQNILSSVGFSSGGATSTNKLRGAMEGDFF